MPSSPLPSSAALAYVGDAVFELFVREWLVRERADRKTHALHQRATALVCAPAQARMARFIARELSLEESEILRRGRNVHGGRAPAGATIAEYRLATGLEGLLGYLYLTDRVDRLRALLSLALTALAEGDKE